MLATTEESGREFFFLALAGVIAGGNIYLVARETAALTASRSDTTESGPLARCAVALKAKAKETQRKKIIVCLRPVDRSR